MRKRKIKQSKTVKRAEPANNPESMPKPPGNYIDTFVKRTFGLIMVFADFLTHYGDESFISQLDLRKLKPAPTHCMRWTLLRWPWQPTIVASTRRW